MTRYTDDRLMRSAAMMSATVSSRVRVVGMAGSAEPCGPIEVLIDLLYEG
jgi:hypothetical protein